MYFTHEQHVKVAVEGCCHGELDTIYAAIQDNERRTREKVDLLLVCGDFECVRNQADLQCLAVPQKYRKLNTFHQYANGEKVAPVMTIFIGGNHEASNVLQNLYYGGFVAPKIYFLGFAGVIWYKGLRIAGLSGIYNGRHYRMSHYEQPPYSDDALRSVYHVRELDVYRMAHIRALYRPKQQQQQLQQLQHVQSAPVRGIGGGSYINNSGAGRSAPRSSIDVFLSHDWPSEIWEYGNKQQLLRKKPYFAADMQTGKLGSPPLQYVLHLLQPTYWFAAHLHVKFAAIVSHPTAPISPADEWEEDEENEEQEELKDVVKKGAGEPSAGGSSRSSSTVNMLSGTVQKSSPISTSIRAQYGAVGTLISAAGPSSAVRRSLLKLPPPVLTESGTAGAEVADMSRTGTGGNTVGGDFGKGDDDDNNNNYKNNKNSSNDTGAFQPSLSSSASASPSLVSSVVATTAVSTGERVGGVVDDMEIDIDGTDTPALIPPSPFAPPADVPSSGLASATEQDLQSEGAGFGAAGKVGLLYCAAVEKAVVVRDEKELDIDTEDAIASSIPSLVVSSSTAGALKAGNVATVDGEGVVAYAGGREQAQDDNEIDLDADGSESTVSASPAVGFGGAGGNFAKSIKTEARRSNLGEGARPQGTPEGAARKRLKPVPPHHQLEPYIEHQQQARPPLPLGSRPPAPPPPIGQPIQQQQQNQQQQEQQQPQKQQQQQQPFDSISREGGCGGGMPVVVGLCATKPTFPSQQLQNAQSNQLHDQQQHHQQQQQQQQQQRSTSFLALDKVLPGRQFLEILKIPVHPRPSTKINHNSSSSASGSNDCIRLDAEWLAVLVKTHHLMQPQSQEQQRSRGYGGRVCTGQQLSMPTLVDPVTPKEVAKIRKLLASSVFGSDLIVPGIPPVPSSGMGGGGKGGAGRGRDRERGLGGLGQDFEVGNFQTDRLLAALRLPHIWTRPCPEGSDPASIGSGIDMDSSATFTRNPADFGTGIGRTQTGNSRVSEPFSWNRSSGQGGIAASNDIGPAQNRNFSSKGGTFGMGSARPMVPASVLRRSMTPAAPPIHAPHISAQQRAHISSAPMRAHQHTFGRPQPPQPPHHTQQGYSIPHSPFNAHSEQHAQGLMYAHYAAGVPPPNSASSTGHAPFDPSHFNPYSQR